MKTSYWKIFNEADRKWYNKEFTHSEKKITFSVPQSKNVFDDSFSSFQGYFSKHIVEKS